MKGFVSQLIEDNAGVLAPGFAIKLELAPVLAASGWLRMAAATSRVIRM